MPIAFLIMATIIWGLGFVGVRWGLEAYSPLWIHCLRFIFAGLLSIPYILFKRPNRGHREALICSLVLFVALLLQTHGIALTTLAKSGFLTVFYCIFTPVLSLIIYRQQFRKTYWALLLCAFVGIALLCEFRFDNFNKGDALILTSSFFFSLHILAVDRFSPSQPPILFNSLQCFYVGVMATLYGPLFEKFPSLTPLLKFSFTQPTPLAGMILLSIFSSLIAFSFQIMAQKRTPPHIVSLAFLLESIFAAFFGLVFFGEKLSPLAVLGCILVLLSVALIPLASNYKKTAIL